MSNPFHHALTAALKGIRVSSWFQLGAWLAIALFMAYGFEWRSPRARFDEINAVDQSLGERVIVIENQQSLNTKMLESLIRGECLDRDSREIRLMGLGPDCERLMGNVDER